MTQGHEARSACARRSITIRNQRRERLTVVLEPWANEYPLEPGQVMQVVEETPEPEATLEIGVEDAHVVVYASVAGSMLRAFRDGVELP